MSNEKDWIDISSALLVPAVAVFGVLIAFFQWRTSELKRKQDLFDKRYSYYQMVRKVYLAAASPEQDADVTDFFDIAEEASFLFGSDIAQHVVAIAGRRIPEQVRHGIVDDWFVQPFRKYLELR